MTWTQLEDETEPPQLERVTSLLKEEPASVELAALSHADKPSSVSHPHDVTNKSDTTVLMAEAVTQIKHCLSP